MTFRRVLTALGLLNVLDAASTQAAIMKGLAFEANPLMAWAISHGWLVFWTLKLGVVGFGVYLLVHSKAKRAALFLLVLYAALIGYQAACWAVWLLT